MRKIPNFAGAAQLSLMDLQALADAVEAQERVLPPASMPARSGSRKYSLANYNLDTKDACSGEAWPNNPGLISSLAFAATAEPRIDKGEMHIPLAHHVDTYNGGDESLDMVTGAIKAVYCLPDVHKPSIVRGDIQIPYAHSLWDDDCDAFCTGVVSTAGVVHSLQYIGTAPRINQGVIELPLADSTACEGAVTGVISGVATDSTSGAYITQGVLHLPESSGDCEPAEYTPGGTSVLGLVRSIDGNTSIQRPDIVDGAIRIPYADTARGAEGLMQGVSVVEGFSDPLICYGYLFLPLADSCNGATGLINGVAADASEPYISAGVLHLPPAELDGLIDAEGNEVPWADLPEDVCEGIILSTHYVGSYTYDLKAAKVNNFLRLQVIQDYSAT